SSKGMREHGDAIELRRLRDELLSMQNLLAERDAEAATGKAQSPSRQEIEAAVAKAQKEWKEGEAARLAAVEARAQEKANRALADAQAQAKSGNDKIDAEIRRLRDELSSTQARLANREKELAQAHNHVKTGKAENDAELRRLRDETGTLQSKLVNRDKELAQAQLAVKDALERGRKTADEMLAKAEAVWKTRESDRMMTAEVQWQETSTKLLADARAQAQAARDESAVELVRLRTELANAQGKLAER